MTSLLRTLSAPFRWLVARQSGVLHGGAVVETIGSVRGDVRGLCADCKPTGAIAVLSVRAEDGSARAALSIEQHVEFGRGDGAIVISLAEPEVRALIAHLRRVADDAPTR